MRHTFFSIFSKYLLVSCLLIFSHLIELYAQQTILVAPSGSMAHDFADSMANEDESITATTTFFVALSTAADFLNAGQSVIVKVASGSYRGKLGEGVWNLPRVINPNGSLQLTGGWNDNFSSQNPFRQPTWLITKVGRPDALISITGRSQLNELVINGFILDAQYANKYMARSGSLSRSSSRELPLIRFSYLYTDHLEITNNVFMNAALGAFDPQIYPASRNTTIDIHNNFFINNVLCLPKLGAVEYRGNIVQTLNLTHNTFLSNWPLNYDSKSSNVGAIMLYHKSGAQNIVIRKNIFAYNPGGAFQHDWRENRMPNMEISENIFYDNAKLFDQQNADGVIAGKFGPNPRYIILDIQMLENDLSYDSRDNQSLDPEISLSPYIKNGTLEAYAPAMNFLPNQLPISPNPELQIYGVQIDN